MTDEDDLLWHRETGTPDFDPPVRKGRGGPRPGFGGKQLGAGRPVKPVGDKPVAIIVDPDTARKIDALRGDLTRAEYLRQLVDGPHYEQH